MELNYKTLKREDIIKCLASLNDENNDVYVLDNGIKEPIMLASWSTYFKLLLRSTENILKSNITTEEKLKEIDVFFKSLEKIETVNNYLACRYDGWFYCGLRNELEKMITT
jgi:hypothetical protein